ncbi:MAG: hypothetical protein Q8K36_01550, partial [Alphaproteobacteria bacterium]|nr:hypothetical protein [Alphaproteobacteria bacterium]
MRKIWGLCLIAIMPLLAAEPEAYDSQKASPATGASNVSLTQDLSFDILKLITGYTTSKDLIHLMVTDR